MIFLMNTKRSSLITDSAKVAYPFLHYLLIFLFIYISDDTLLFGTNANEAYTSFKYLFVMGAAVLLTIVNILKGRRIPVRAFSTLLLMIFLIFITMIVNEDVRLGYFYKICLLLYGLAITQIMELKEFAIIFNKIITILAVASLVGYVIMIISPSILRLFPTILNTSNYKFYNAFIVLEPSFYSTTLRNYGIFREPGIYQMFLIMALLFQMFVVKKDSLMRYLIYIAAILTTLSTTGYIALGVVFLMFLVNSGGLSRGKKYVLIIIFVVAFLLLFLFTDIFSFKMGSGYSDSIFNKLVNPEDSSSGVARFASVTENIRIAFESHIFGVGLTTLSEKFPLYALAEYGRITTHNTNTLLIQFATHGFLYGSVWLWSYWHFAKRLNAKLSIFVFAIIVILYMGENLTFSGFSSLFLMYGVTSPLNKQSGNFKNPQHMAHEKDVDYE